MGSLLFSSRVRVRVRIRFSVWLVSGYAHVLILLSVAIVTPPFSTDTDHRRITPAPADQISEGSRPL